MPSSPGFRRRRDERTREPASIGEVLDGLLREQAFAGGVDHAERAGFVVEGEDGDVNLGHHAPQQRGRLERAQPALAQLVHQRVHLEHREAQRVVRVGAARAERVVLLPDGGKHVRERLERTHDALAEGEGEREPGAHEEQGERPLRARGEVSPPEQPERDGERRERRGEREARDLALVGSHGTRGDLALGRDRSGRAAP